MSDWLYAKVFLAPSEARVDALLLEHVEPLLAGLASSGLSRGAFFVLYGERGFHLRLRVRPGPGAAPLVQAALDRAVARARAALAGLPPDPALGFGSAPGLRLEWDTYEAEIDKHGGPEGQSVAEAHFEDSSRAAFAFRRARRAGRVTRAQAALWLLAALHRALVPGSRGAFFAAAREHWLGLAPAAQAEAWRRYFEERTPAALAALERELAPEPTREPALAAGLARWRSDLALTARALERLEERGRLQRPRSSVAHNFVHMLCNRLGVPVLEEAFLSHLLAQADEPGLRREGAA